MLDTLACCSLRVLEGSGFGARVEILPSLQTAFEKDHNGQQFH